MMKLDLNKPVQTRDGRKARVVCTDYKSSGGKPFEVIAVVEDDKRERVFYYGSDGKFGGASLPNKNDLVNIPERHSEFQNVYTQGFKSANRGRTRLPMIYDGLGYLEYVFEGDKIIEVIFHSEQEEKK